MSFSCLLLPYVCHRLLPSLALLMSSCLAFSPYLYHRFLPSLALPMPSLLAFSCLTYVIFSCFLSLPMPSFLAFSCLTYVITSCLLSLLMSSFLAFSLYSCHLFLPSLALPMPSFLAFSPYLCHLFLQDIRKNKFVTFPHLAFVLPSYTFCMTCEWFLDWHRSEVWGFSHEQQWWRKHCILRPNDSWGPCWGQFLVVLKVFLIALRLCVFIWNIIETQFV